MGWGTSMRCPCCNGTGTIRYGSGRSEAALLRDELARAYSMLDRLTEFTASHMGVAAEAIADPAAKLAAALQGWNSRTGRLYSWRYGWPYTRAGTAARRTIPSAKRPQKTTGTRRGGRGRTAQGRAAQAEKDPLPVPGRDGLIRDRREAQAHGGGGGQPRHKSRSRKDKPERIAGNEN